MKKLKVLSLGFGQANFLCQLYGGIRALDKDIIFDLDIIQRFSTGKEKGADEEAINEIKNFKEKVNSLDLFFASIQLLFSRYTYIYLLSRYQNDGRFKFAHILRIVKSKAVVNRFLANSDYAVYHFHYCEPASLLYLYFLPGNKKIICSFWGSDLMRVNGIFNYYLQEQALRKASIITTHSPELREIILAKFGRHLKSKIRYALFNLEPRLFNLMDELSNNMLALEEFRKQFGITTPHIVVIGHNAKSYNNHLEVLRNLELCSDRVKSTTTFVLPFTYGAIPNYVQKVEDVCAKLSIKTVLLKSFLSWEDLAALKICSDIMIHMPESDAMSSAAMEAMYAGSLLIAGSWLPYGSFRRSGLAFKDIVDFNALPELVNSFIDGKISLTDKQKAENRRIIKEQYFPVITSKAWINIYREMWNHKNQC